ncbi:MAG: hypothetical protein ACRDNW_09080 [Trebonia sp.]
MTDVTGQRPLQCYEVRLSWPPEVTALLDFRIELAPGLVVEELLALLRRLLLKRVFGVLTDRVPR